MRVKIHIQKHRYAENSGEVLILTTLSTVPTAFYLSFSVSYIIYAFMKLLTAVLGNFPFSCTLQILHLFSYLHWIRSLTFFCSIKKGKKEISSVLTHSLCYYLPTQYYFAALP